MKKFFSFRSSGSNSENGNPSPQPPKKENLYWEKPLERNVKDQANDICSDISKGSKDSSFNSRKQQSSSNSRLRRSLSFSSPLNYIGPEEHDSSCSSGPRRSPTTCSNVLNQALECPTRCHSLTPERFSNSRRSDLMVAQMTSDKCESPCYADSLTNSPGSSPVPLKCQTHRFTEVPKDPNKVLDLYIDGEQQERNSRSISDSSLRNSPVSRKAVPSIDSRVFPSSRHPPRGKFGAPAPTNRKGHLRSYSFREISDAHLCHSRDHMRGEVRSSPQRPAKYLIERQTECLPPNSKLESHDFDYETSSTAEDIFEDNTELHPSFNLDGPSHMSSILLHSSFQTKNDISTKEIPGFQNRKFSKGEDLMSINSENKYLEREEDIDALLRRKVKEAEKRVLFFSEDLEEGKLTFKDIMDELQNMSREVSAQIQCRISERVSAREALKLAKKELDSRTRRLEKEKNELQLNLEKELDRRSSDWSFMLEKYQLEEQRLRERVRELAEHNVSLQREVSSFTSREMEATTRMKDLESRLNDANLRMEEKESENDVLQEALSKLQDGYKETKSELDCIKRSYKEKEKETNDLHKSVTRLQRVYCEQESTICGLRQGLIDEIDKQPLNKCDNLVKLQMEQVRLTGVEQALRKEIDAYKLEVSSLRHENINLIERLNGGRFSLFRLEEELRAQVDYSRNQCFSLLDESSHICGNLLELLKMYHIHESSEKGQDVKSGFDGYSIVEYDMKLQSFKRAIENLRRGMQTISEILHEKADIDASESQLRSTRGHPLEREVEHELKAEILLTRALREKLHSQELELQKLQGDLASSVRGNDILRNELQRSQDALSRLTHKMKDLELKMIMKEENITQLQNNLQECMKELSVTQGILPKVSQERDLMWEEVKQYSEKNMMLNYEVNTLKKKIEALDEDVLFKEGQITILKDSLKNKPFDILYDPNSPKDFIMQ